MLQSLTNYGICYRKIVCIVLLHNPRAGVKQQQETGGVYEKPC
jgi:hypothetical protein